MSHILSGASIKRAVAEAVGTFTLVFAGCGSIMVSERFPGALPAVVTPIVFGLAIAVMVYAVGFISGAHFNPAVTLGVALSGRLPKREVIPYWIAQCLGSLAAIILLFFLLPQGKGFGATVPSVSALQAIGWEAVLTFFLVFVVISVATDERAVSGMAGVAIGGTIMLSAFVGGPVTGASMNPARSLAPAIFQGQLGVLWIYIVGPAIGAIIAALLSSRLPSEKGRR